MVASTLPFVYRRAALVAWLLMEVKHAADIALGCLVLWFGLAGLLRAETPRVAALPSVRPETGADEGAPKPANRSAWM